MKTAFIGIRLDADTRAALEALSKGRPGGISGLVTRVLANYIKGQRKCSSKKQSARARERSKKS